MPTTTFTVTTPDGKDHHRKSVRRSYSHAVAYFQKATPACAPDDEKCGTCQRRANGEKDADTKCWRMRVAEWIVATWCGRRDLAQREARNFEARTVRPRWGKAWIRATTEHTILEVRITHVTKPRRS